MDGFEEVQTELKLDSLVDFQDVEIITQDQRNVVELRATPIRAVAFATARSRASSRCVSPTNDEHRGS